LDEYQKKLDKNLEIIKKEKLGKEITDERRALFSKLKTLNEEKLRLESELKKFEDSNPVEYERMKKSIEVCKRSISDYHYLFDFVLIRYCLFFRWPRKRETVGQIMYFQ